MPVILTWRRQAGSRDFLASQPSLTIKFQVSVRDPSSNNKVFSSWEMIPWGMTFSNHMCVYTCTCTPTRTQTNMYHIHTNTHASVLLSMKWILSCVGIEYELRAKRRNINDNVRKDNKEDTFLLVRILFFLWALLNTDQGPPCPEPIGSAFHTGPRNFLYTLIFH